MSSDPDIVRRKLLGLELCPHCNKEVKSVRCLGGTLPNGYAAEYHLRCPVCDRAFFYESRHQQPKS
ncbi:hypothetical protein KAR91_61020 [Candidatus Pacearchaeota archaeon]|nr:hypothetical protein [Candidatus Pacearchaeota archaeon]